MSTNESCGDHPYHCNNSDPFGFWTKSCNDMKLAFGVPSQYWEYYDSSINNFYPTHIIYNEPTTICFFADGSKVMARCSKEEKYVPEYGVMACIIKKLFGSRSEFLRLVASGYEQPKKIK